MNCFRCGAEIFFDDEHITNSGKKIPLDEIDGEYEPHDCPANDWKKTDKPITNNPTLEQRVRALEERVQRLES